MANASADSRLGGLFVPAPTTTKRLKISCLFLGSFCRRHSESQRLQRILPSGFASSKLSIPGRAAATRRNSQEQGRGRRRGRKEDAQRGEKEGKWLFTRVKAAKPHCKNTPLQVTSPAFIVHVLRRQNYYLQIEKFIIFCIQSSFFLCKILQNKE